MIYRKIVLDGMKMKEKILKNYKGIFFCLLISAAILSVGKICIKSINTVLEAGTKTYYVTERSMETVETKEEYEKEFLCVGKEMEKIQIEVSTTENSKGNILYKITDVDKNILIEKTCEIEELMGSDDSGLYIDVSELGLTQGQRYVVTINFEEAEDVEVILGDGNLSLRQYFGFSYKTEYIVAIIICMLLITGWLFFVLKKGINAKVFFVTMLFVGIVVACVLPPANRDDEYRHFIKAYTEAVDHAYIEDKQVDGTENGMIGGYGPVATVPYVINEIRLMDYESNHNGYGYLQELNFSLCLDKLIATIKSDPIDESCQVGATATAERGYEYYWPQIIAMKIANLLGVSDLFLYYVARFGQVLVCALMGAVAIWIAPRLKEIIWLLTFIPNTLLLISSCNCDGLLILEIMLLTAVIVWMKDGRIPLLSRNGVVGMIAYLILTYNIVVMKIPYVIVCLGLLLYLGKDNIPKTVSFLKKQKNLTIVLGGILLTIAFVAIIISNKELLMEKVYSFVSKEHVDYIDENTRYIYGLFTKKWREMMKQLYVAICGYNFIPYPIMIIGILMLLKKNQPIYKKIGFALLFSVMVMVIVLVGYIMTPPDYGVIWGITYRYILPFVIIIGLCLPIGTDMTEKIAKKLTPLAIYIIMGTSLVTWLVEWSI